MTRAYLMMIAMLTCQTAMAQEQVYTPTQLFNGTLYLATLSELTPTQAGILQAELDRTNNLGSLFGIGTAEQSQQSALWKLLKDRTWADAPTLLAGNDWNEEASGAIKQLKRGSCLWIDHRALIDTPEAMQGTRAELLRTCLQRGVLVIFECTHAESPSPIAAQWKLLPDIDVVRMDKQPLATSSLVPNRVRIQLPRTVCLESAGVS